MEEKREKAQRLWTHNFTIITLGSVVSMFGNMIAGFALGLLVLDYTGSTFLYALHQVMFILPSLIVPTLAGPFIDKFSRRKTIYTLDFISTAMYGIYAWLLFSGGFNYGFLLAGCLILGSIESIYQVTFTSFYPMLISEGNFTKAYSIQSTMESVTTFMVPVSAVLYNLVGIVPLFLINMASFLIAAVMETRITPVEEAYTRTEGEGFGFKQYKKNFKEGLDYLRSERGLMAIALYFTVSMFAGAAMSTIALPYFKLNFENGEYIYVLTTGWITVGRLIGGVIHYKVKYPTEKKFAIALTVYTAICFIDGTSLYFPFVVMGILMFAEGILGVTSYNIRISATQSYVPNDKKGRFNGIFQTMTFGGMLFGQLLSGMLSEVISPRLVISAFMVVNLVAVIVIMGGNRKEVARIYNRQA